MSKQKAKLGISLTRTCWHTSVHWTESNFQQRSVKKIICLQVGDEAAVETSQPDKLVFFLWTGASGRQDSPLNTLSFIFSTISVSTAHFLYRDGS